MPSAFTRPSTMCSRSFALPSRYSVRRGDDLHLVRDVDERSPGRASSSRGHAVDERQHVHREARLHRRVLVELVEHDVRVRVAAELDDQARRVARGLVAHVADALDLALVDELGDLLADDLDRRLERHLGDDDPRLAALALFDLGDRAHLDGAATLRVRVLDAVLAEDQRAGREVGALHDLHELDDLRVGIVDHVHRGVDDLTEVVRRDVRRHADRDAAAAVDEQVREARGQHRSARSFWPS